MKLEAPSYGGVDLMPRYCEIDKNSQSELTVEHLHMQFSPTEGTSDRGALGGQDMLYAHMK